MKTIPEPPGNDFKPLGKPIRPEAKPAPTAPAPTENPRIGKRIDGMLETLIPGNDGKVPESDFPGQAPCINSNEIYKDLVDYLSQKLEHPAALEARIAATLDGKMFDCCYKDKPADRISTKPA